MAFGNTSLLETTEQGKFEGKDYNCSKETVRS